MAFDLPPPTRHQPVLLRETLEQLQIESGAVIVDGTFGGGGHTRVIAEQIGADGRVIAIDRDPQAVDRAKALAANLPVIPYLGNYCDLPEILRDLGLETVDGILLDLGLSSDQLADDDRGFSFQSNGPLDLRFDPTRGEPAWRLLEHISERALADLIFRYGEERYSRRIARAVAERRRKREPIRTAADLAELVRRCVPRGRQRIDPATRTFQALRIAVNDELGSLERALKRLPECLRPGGRFAIISFHSLEDRLVKHAFRNDPRLHAVTRKPICPSEGEIAANPRSRSAKLRVAERV